MKKKSALLSLPEGDHWAEVMEYEPSDRKMLAKVYKNWRTLCSELRILEGRAVNLPEVLSESAFCLEMGSVRLISGLTGAVSSFDCYDLSSSERIQVKACSVLPDLTSFGPTSQWDKIYFLDFYRDGKWDGTFNIYLLDNDDVYNHPVNSRQTLRDQQSEGRRPRFSIHKELIVPKKLKPVKVGRLL